MWNNPFSRTIRRASLPDLSCSSLFSLSGGNSLAGMVRSSSGGFSFFLTRSWGLPPAQRPSHRMSSRNSQFLFMRTRLPDQVTLYSQNYTLRSATKFGDSSTLKKSDLRQILKSPLPSTLRSYMTGTWALISNSPSRQWYARCTNYAIEQFSQKHIDSWPAKLPSIINNISAKKSARFSIIKIMPKTKYLQNKTCSII